MTKRKHKALVIAALDVAGRHIVEELLTRPDWDVGAVARRSRQFPNQAQYVSVDIADADACHPELAPIGDVTHVFYAARNDAGDPAEQAWVNLGMLRNVLDTVEAASPRFRTST